VSTTTYLELFVTEIEQQHANIATVIGVDHASANVDRMFHSQT
jgi:hypothetical protein